MFCVTEQEMRIQSCKMDFEEKVTVLLDRTLSYVPIVSDGSYLIISRLPNVTWQTMCDVWDCEIPSEFTREVKAKRLEASLYKWVGYFNSFIVWSRNSTICFINSFHLQTLQKSYFVCGELEWQNGDIRSVIWTEWQSGWIWSTPFQNCSAILLQCAWHSSFFENIWFRNINVYDRDKCKW